MLRGGCLYTCVCIHAVVSKHLVHMKGMFGAFASAAPSPSELQGRQIGLRPRRIVDFSANGAACNFGLGLEPCHDAWIYLRVLYVSQRSLDSL